MSDEWEEVTREELRNGEWVRMTWRQEGRWSGEIMEPHTSFAIRYERKALFGWSVTADGSSDICPECGAAEES